MGFTLGSHKTVKRGEEPPYCRFMPSKTRDLDPSSYFPNSFSRRFGEYRTEGIVGIVPASQPLTGKTWTAFITNCTSSPSLRSRFSTDSVVRTEAICAGAETSNLTSDITSSDFIEVTVALIWFLAPYCCISFAAPFALDVPRRPRCTQEDECSTRPSHES